jgi:hypothetical protein
MKHAFYILSILCSIAVYSQETVEKEDETLQKGSNWIAEQQNKDGSWGEKHKVILTSLAINFYLANGETTTSKKYGLNVQRGMSFLNTEAAKAVKELKVGIEGAFLLSALTESYLLEGNKDALLNCKKLASLLKPEVPDKKYEIIHSVTVAQALRSLHIANISVIGGEKYYKDALTNLAKNTNDHRRTLAYYFLLSHLKKQTIDEDKLALVLEEIKKQKSISPSDRYMAVITSFNVRGKLYKEWRQLDSEHMVKNRLKDGSFPGNSNPFDDMTKHEKKIYSSAFSGFTAIIYFAYQPTNDKARSFNPFSKL